MSRPSEEHFDVFLYERPVARLIRRGDQTRCVFEEGYCDDPKRPVLGLRFEEDLHRNWSAIRRLPAWFSNLLPEGPLREWIGIAADVSVHQEMDLLARVGHDLPGAVRILRSEEPPPTTADNEAPAEADAKGTDTPQWRFSLAGVALKFSMIAKGDRLTSPATGEHGDWIVKTPDLRHDHVPENEFAMMSLARHAGIEVPDVRLVTRDDLPFLPDDVWGRETQAYAVRRFDRGAQREPIHIEDFAQVRGFYPERKYVGTLETLASLIYRRRDVASLREFARRLTFNTLVGNGDAHLKNWSLIYRDRRRPVLSPAYDLVATFAYRPNDQPEDLGLSLGGSKSFSKVGPASLEKLEAKLSAKAGLGEVAVQTARATLEHCELVNELLDPVAPELAARIATRIRQEARSFLGT